MYNKCSAVAEIGDRLATIDMGREEGGCMLCRFRGDREHNVAWTKVYLRTKWHRDPSSRLATIHQRYRQTGQTGQRSDSIGEPFYKRSPKN